MILNRVLSGGREFLWSLVARLPFAVLVTLFVAVVWGQSVTHAQGNETPFMELVPGSRSVWFFVFIGWYVFSAITSGMPEPTKESSPWYIWAYRSFHILSANGTSFFQNKLYWADPQRPKEQPAKSNPLE